MTRLSTPGRSPSRLFRLAAVLSLVCAISACRSTDPALYTSDGQLVESLPRSMYRVAITPVLVEDAPEVVPVDDTGAGEEEGGEDAYDEPGDVSGDDNEPGGDASGDDDPDEAAADGNEADEDSELEWTLTPIEVRDRIVSSMNGLLAATDVLAIDETEHDAALSAAYEQGCDLLIVPRMIGTPKFAHHRTSGRWPLSIGLWLTTWIGGMFVEDATYRVDARIVFDVFATENRIRVAQLEVKSGQTQLSFIDRNEFPTTQWLESLIIPLFWTSDSASGTSEELSERLCDHFAGRATGFLKEDFKRIERDELGAVELRSPINGQEVVGVFQLDGTIIAHERITAARIYVDPPGTTRANVDAEPIWEASDTTVDKQLVGGRFHVPLGSVTMTLSEPGWHSIIMVIELRGDPTTRTIKVNNVPLED